MKKTRLLLQLCIATAILLTSCDQSADNLTATNNYATIEQLQDSIKCLRAKIDTVSNVNAQAVIVPVSNSILKGGKYEAKIYLTGTNSISKPIITVNGDTLEGNTYTVNCNTVGSFDINGKIVFTKPDGTIDECPFQTSYIVNESNAVISPDLMKILYSGYKNPISISVPGISSQNIQVAATNVREIKRGKNSTWVITPKDVNEICTVTVSVKNEDGTIQKVGCKDFIVRSLPSPITYLEYYIDGKAKRCYSTDVITKDELMKATSIKIKATLKVLDIDYTVRSFSIFAVDAYGNPRNLENNDCFFSKEQLALIRQVEPGNSFIIKRVEATGPDGRILPKGMEVSIVEDEEAELYNLISY